eukprot:g670.t1
MHPYTVRSAADRVGDGAWGRATGFPARTNTLRRSAYDTFRSRYGVPTDAAGRGFALRGLTTGNVVHDEHHAGAGNGIAGFSPSIDTNAACAQAVQVGGDAALGAVGLVNGVRDAASSARGDLSRGTVAVTPPVLPVDTGGMVPATPNTISKLRVDMRASQSPEIGATHNIVARRISAAVQTASNAAVQEAIDTMRGIVKDKNTMSERVDEHHTNAAAEAGIGPLGHVGAVGEHSSMAVGDSERWRTSHGARSLQHTEPPPYPFYYGVPASASIVNTTGTTRSSDLTASSPDFVPDVSDDPDYALQIAQAQVPAQAQALAPAQVSSQFLPMARAHAARRRQRGPPRSKRGLWGFMSGRAVSENRAAAAAEEYEQRMRALNESAVQRVLERGQADMEGQVCDFEHMTGNERQEYLRHIRKIARELHEAEQKRKAAEDQEFYEFLRRKSE